MKKEKRSNALETRKIFDAFERAEVPLPPCPGCGAMSLKGERIEFKERFATNFECEECGYWVEFVGTTPTDSDPSAKGHS